MNPEARTGIVSWLALFLSTGTLLCCALPIVFVSFGFGAAVAALSSNFSFLTTLALHKTWVFAASGGLLGLSGWLVSRPDRVCPPDTAVAEQCENMVRRNQRIFRVSLATWAVGFFFAYLALPLRMSLGV
jgi:high-affinity Fe2+/Pb2+ permease